MRIMVVDDYISYISNNSGNEEITDNKYGQIMSALQNKPSAPDGYVYRLRANSLEWELCELPAGDPPEDPPKATEQDFLAALEEVGIIDTD